MLKHKAMTAGLVVMALCLGLAAAYAAVSHGDDAHAAAQTGPLHAAAPRDFDDWRLACAETEQGVKTKCTIFQRNTFDKASSDKAAGDKTGSDKTAGDKETGKILALTTVVHIEKGKDKPVTMIRLVTPPGSFLIPGMIIKIDDGKEAKIPYMQCLPGGCMTDLVFGKTMLDKMKAGKAMLVAYRAPDGANKTVKVSLKGFPKAFDVLSEEAAKK